MELFLAWTGQKCRRFPFCDVNEGEECVQAALAPQTEPAVSVRNNMRVSSNIPVDVGFGQVGSCSAYQWDIHFEYEGILLLLHHILVTKAAQWPNAQVTTSLARWPEM